MPKNQLHIILKIQMEVSSFEKSYEDVENCNVFYYRPWESSELKSRMLKKTKKKKIVKLEKDIMLSGNSVQELHKEPLKVNEENINSGYKQDQPNRLKVYLMPHQKQALDVVERSSSSCRRYFS